MMVKRISWLVSLLVVVMWAGGPLLASPLASPQSQFFANPGQKPFSVPWDAALSLGVLVVFGITIRRSTADIANKLVRNATAASGDYKDGVAASGQEWQTNAAASEGNYEVGVQDAINKKRFGKGIARAGAAKFVKNASELGSQRYAPGISNAKDAYIRGVQPALDLLKSLTLPPKGPKRSPQNRERSAAVQIALGALKDSQ